MIKVKLSPNLVSFVTVRRGNWVLKVSAYKTFSVLIVGYHYYGEQFFVKHFKSHNEAADFIDAIITEESDYE